VVVVVIVAVSGNNPGPTPTPPSPPPTVEPAALNSVLLTPHEIESIVGATKLESSDIYHRMANDPVAISNPDCAGAQYNALRGVYEGSGYSTVADQVLSMKEPEFIYVDQSAVLFPTADQARTFLRTSADTWKRCAGQTLTTTSDDGTKNNWTFDDVTENDSQIAQGASQEGMRGYGCQHVIQVVSNVIIEAQACTDRITDEATRIAEQMAAKVPT
jgi:serine/threonine-protein kinase